MIFEISNENRTSISSWLYKEVYPEIVKNQKETFKKPTPFIEELWQLGYPYEGALGGGLTYCFTPTSLGLVIKVKYGDKELDLTDYDSW